MNNSNEKITPDEIDSGTEPESAGAQLKPSKAWWLLPLALLALMLSLFVSGLHNDPTALPSVKVGKQIPAFELPTLDDPSVLVTPQQLLGQAYLLNVWATWCPTCYVEHPYLLKLAQDQGVRIIGINYKDDAEKARAYLQKLGNPYAQVLQDSGRFGIDLGVYGAPETFLISASGEILLRRAGDLNERVWQDEFLPLLTAVNGNASKRRVEVKQ